MANELQEQAQKLLEESKKISKTERHNSFWGSTVFRGPQTKKWLNDVKLFLSRLPKNYPLKDEIEDLYYQAASHRNIDTLVFDDMVACLKSISTDNLLNAERTLTQNLKSIEDSKKYDLFISHANKDKSIFANELYETLSKLGIRIFYDKEAISWGDNWKEKILNGTAQSEFAVIVISENFFGREWTERELKEFLQQQNSSHQKTILPLLYNITRDDLLSKYPFLEEIQYISNQDHSAEEICILFAKELIKRLRG